MEKKATFHLKLVKFRAVKTMRGVTLYHTIHCEDTHCIYITNTVIFSCFYRKVSVHHFVTQKRTVNMEMVWLQST